MKFLASPSLPHENIITTRKVAGRLCFHRRHSVNWEGAGRQHQMHHGIGHMVGYPPLNIRPGDLPSPISDLGTFSLDIRPGTYPLLVTPGGDHWRSVQTCLFGDLIPLNRNNIWWWQLN